MEETKEFPSSHETEQKILGLILWNNDLLAVAKDKLIPEDFYSDDHRAIFECMTSGRCALDEIAIYNELKSRQHPLGGELAPLKYILSLTDNCLRINSIDAYVEILQKCRLARETLVRIEMIRDAAFQPWEIFQKQLESASKSIPALHDTARFISGDKISDPVKKAEEYFRQRFVLHENKKNRIPVPGWNYFNAKIGGGFKHGRNYIVASRPGSGKTSLITHLAVAFGKQEQPGLMVQVENPEFDIWDKIVANVCQINSLTISDRPDSLTQAEHERIQDAVKQYGRYIFVEHRNIVTVDEICRRIFEYKKQFNIQWFMVDYLQRIRGDKRKNELENITYHVQTLDELAERLDLVCILISMANRDAEGGKIQMRHMKGSGEIEQAADVLMALQTNEEMADQELEVIKLEILKNRHGYRGPVDMQFKKSYSYLTENLGEFRAGS